MNIHAVQERHRKALTYAAKFDKNGWPAMRDQYQVMATYYRKILTREYNERVGGAREHERVGESKIH